MDTLLELSDFSASQCDWPVLAVGMRGGDGWGEVRGEWG